MGAQADQKNFSNEMLTTQDILLMLNLYNGFGIADWFINNVVSEGLSESEKRDIKRNFPRMNYFAWIIDRVAYSMPGVDILYQPDMDDIPDFTPQVADPLNPASDPAALAATNAAAKAAYEADKKAKKAKQQESVEEMDEVIREIMERQTWEGEKDFWSALPLWRIFLLICGDTFVKLPWDDIMEGIMPERMGPQYSMIMLSGRRKKEIGGYRFEYPLGGTTYTPDPLGENTRIEVINAKEWTISDSSKGGKLEEVKNQPVPAELDGLIPVAHMAWKEREDHPRGMPFMRAIMEKCLHIYSIQLGRRIGNKYNAAPIIVRINAAGSPPSMNQGETHDIYDKSPMHKADVKVVGGGLSMQSTEQEYKDAIEELENLAFLPHEAQERNSMSVSPSGKASEMLSKSQVTFREAFTKGEGSFLCDLFYKILILEGYKCERKDITAQYDSIQQPTAQQKQDRANELFAEGFIQQGLREMDFEEEQIDKMMLERSSEKQSSVSQFMSGIQPTQGAMNEPMPGPKEGPQPPAPGPKAPIAAPKPGM